MIKMTAYFTMALSSKCTMFYYDWGVSYAETVFMMDYHHPFTHLRTIAWHISFFSCLLSRWILVFMFLAACCSTSLRKLRVPFPTACLIAEFSYFCFFLHVAVQAWGDYCHTEGLWRTWNPCTKWSFPWGHKIHGDPRWTWCSYPRKEGTLCSWSR